VPNNAMLVVVGAVTREQVEAAAKKWFGAIPRGEAPPRPADASPEPKQTEKRRKVVEPGQIGLIVGGYHIPEGKHKDIYALQLASVILGAGESSRLHQRLVSGEKVSVQAAAPILVREHPGLFALFAAYLDPGQSDKIEALLADEVAKLRRAPVTARELAKAKNQLLSAFVFSLEGVAGVAQRIGTSWIQTGDPAAWLSSIERFNAVTVADIQRVANAYLTENNSTVVVIPPRGATGK
ncbi:MAG: pitrilysin family protein, partial [Myxococcota bacterium]